MMVKNIVKECKIYNSLNFINLLRWKRCDFKFNNINVRKIDFLLLILCGHCSNNCFQFQDCHGSLSDNPAPIQDDTQNYMIDSGYQNATHTQVSIDNMILTVIYNGEAIWKFISLRYMLLGRTSSVLKISFFLNTETSGISSKN